MSQRTMGAYTGMGVSDIALAARHVLVVPRAGGRDVTTRFRPER